MDLSNVEELNFFCRLCLQRSKELLDIFKNNENSPNSKELTLPSKILACVSIEVTCVSPEPKKICLKCLNNINSWYNFKISCNANNDVLQKYLRDIQEKNKTVLSEATPITEDTILFPDFSLPGYDSLLEKSVSLGSNISSIVNYFLTSEKKECKNETENSIPKVKNDPTKLERYEDTSVCKKKSVNKEKGYLCELCHLHFSHFSLLLSHDEKSHFTETRNFSCSVCEKLFISEDRVNTHKKLVHRQKTFQCSVCDKFFISMKSLEVHRRLHSEKYKCEKCGYLSTSKLYLSQHIQKHNGVDVSFHCEICQKKFSQKSSLLRHHKLHLKNQGKCYKCSICYLLFRSQSELTSHKSTHNAKNKSEIHKCKTCTKEFSSRKTLIVHITRHQEPRFSCVVCEKKLKSNYDLRVHMETHSDSKTFDCFHCNKKFSFKKTLTKHLKKHYPRIRSDVVI